MMSSIILRQFYPSSLYNLCKINTITTKSNFRRPYFGIVAAVSKDGVIGVNGSLPSWNIPQDRNHFVNLTRNKILIVGRKTFSDEDKSGNHIKHARVCIVISKTMDEEDIVNGSRDDTSGPHIMLARSFDEALDMSSGKLLLSGNNQTISTDDVEIWVAGGEGIYLEALQHKNAKEIQLTYVDISVDPAEITAYFPLEYLDDFHEVSRVKSGICSFCVYRK